MKRYDGPQQVKTDGVEHRETRAPGVVVLTSDQASELRAEPVHTSIRELLAQLRKLHHPNILASREAIDDSGSGPVLLSHHSPSHIPLQDHRGRLRDDQAKLVLFQVLSAVDHAHARDVCHGSIDDTTVLVSPTLDVRLAGWGNLRRGWAPEEILQLPVDAKADIWYCGLLLVELGAGRKPFEARRPSDRMFKYCSVIGSPNETSWPEGSKQATRRCLDLGRYDGTGLEGLMRDSSPELVDLAKLLLVLNPEHRPCAALALKHPDRKSVV